MMGWVFANLKSRTCKTTVWHPNLRRIPRASYGFTAIIVTSKPRGSRLAASGLRSRRPQLGSRYIQEKFQPAAERRPPLAIRSAGTHQRSLALIDEPATRQTDKDHQITLPSAAKLVITLTDFVMQALGIGNAH